MQHREESDGRCHPIQQQGAHSAGESDVADTGPGISAHAWHILMWTPTKVTLDLSFYRNPEEIEKEE